MGQTVQIKAADGQSFDAYVAQPQGKPRAALVVLQEIFGVNHISERLLMVTRWRAFSSWRRPRFSA